MIQLVDKFERVHDYLRISLTDKCNLKCLYCNPDGDIQKLLHSQILTYDELTRLIKIFVSRLGTKKIRLTGGEPLARKDILSFFESLYEFKKKNPFQLCVTTNGTLLEDKIEMLKYWGLDKINISLDSLQRNRFEKITGADCLETVLRSIDLAEELNFTPVKINVVVMRGINDDEILDFVEFVKDRDMNIRFIEFMPFSDNRWNESSFISYDEIKNIISEKYDLVQIQHEVQRVAKDFKIKNHKATVSFISSISNHFCGSCNRLRITSSGKLKLCLFTPINEELDLRKLLRSDDFSDDEIVRFINNSLDKKNFQHPDVGELLKLEKNNMLAIGG